MEEQTHSHQLSRMVRTRYYILLVCTFPLQYNTNNCRSHTWKALHPRWQYRLWTDEDNRGLVARHYPWFLPTYDALPRGIMRADAVRYLYMHRHGGVYADLDTVCVRPLDAFLVDALPQQSSTGGSTSAVLALMSDDIAFEHNIPNAWMASTPGHPFWLFVVGIIDHRHRQHQVSFYQWMAHVFRPLKAEYVTGPVVLKQAYDTWVGVVGGNGGKVGGVVVVPPGSIFVADWYVLLSCLHKMNTLFFFSLHVLMFTHIHLHITQYKNRHNLTALDEYWEECNGDDILKKYAQERCLRAYPNAHVLTYWTHSWSR